MLVYPEPRHGVDPPALEETGEEVVGVDLSEPYSRTECADCWVSGIRSIGGTDKNDGAFTRPLTHTSDADYFQDCHRCGTRIDLRYTPEATAGERRHAPSRSTWSDP